MTKRRVARTVVISTAIAVLIGGGVAGYQLTGRGEEPVASPTPAPAATVAIARKDLSLQVEVDGRLGFGGARKVEGKLAGTVTWLPRAGTAVRRGEVLYRVDNKPVLLLYGVTPLFRTLGPPPRPPATPPAAHSSKPAAPASPSPKPAQTTQPPVVHGPDVKVLKQNLAALGFLSSAGSDRLSGATISAVERWQKSLGLEPTGVLDPASVVVLPGQVRVDQVLVGLGDAGQGEVLGITSASKIVTVPLDATKAGMTATGARVLLVLPNGKQSTGRVLSVGRNAVPASDQGPADQPPTVTAVIGIDDQSAVGAIDSGPVTVTLPGETRRELCPDCQVKLNPTGGDPIVVGTPPKDPTGDVAKSLGHFRLDACGIGLEACDAANAGWYFGEGDVKNGTLSAIGVLPIAGIGATLGKWFGKGTKLSDEAATAEKATADAVCSFSGATLVEMSDGSTKPISEIKVGDEVVATDPETGRHGPRKVTHLWVHHDVLLILETATGQLVTTEDHPFWNATDGEFQRADQLDTGDELLPSAARRWPTAAPR